MNISEFLYENCDIHKYISIENESPKGSFN